MPNMEDLPTNDPKDPHYISPQNRMDPERIKEILKNKDDKDDKEAKPVIEIIEGKLMPLFIRALNMQCLGQIMNFMMVILYNKEKNKIEIRGRMRYEESGNKTILGGMEETYTEENYKTAQKFLRKKMDTLVNPEMPFELLEPAQEVTFGINDTGDEIIKKINDSNMFNIGTQKIT